MPPSPKLLAVIDAANSSPSEKINCKLSFRFTFKLFFWEESFTCGCYGAVPVQLLPVHVNFRSIAIPGRSGMTCRTRWGLQVRPVGNWALAGLGDPKLSNLIRMKSAPQSWVQPLLVCILDLFFVVHILIFSPLQHLPFFMLFFSLSFLIEFSEITPSVHLKYESQPSKNAAAKSK